jgi:hypothetical protein
MRFLYWLTILSGYGSEQDAIREARNSPGSDIPSIGLRKQRSCRLETLKIKVKGAKKETKGLGFIWPLLLLPYRHTLVILYILTLFFTLMILADLTLCNTIKLFFCDLGRGPS